MNSIEYPTREKEDLKAIAEETADVTIMLEQLRIIFNMNDQVCDQMDSKVMRLADRLKMDVTEIIPNGDV